jgi:hypothetical protein
MGYNARNDEIRDNVTRMRREWEAQHKLPQHLLELKPLEDCSPDQLAYLMMAATNAQGGRAAFWSQTEQRFEQVQSADQAQFLQH